MGSGPAILSEAWSSGCGSILFPCRHDAEPAEHAPPEALHVLDEAATGVALKKVVSHDRGVRLRLEPTALVCSLRERLANVHVGIGVQFDNGPAAVRARRVIELLISRHAHVVTVVRREADDRVE